MGYYDYFDHYDYEKCGEYAASHRNTRYVANEIVYAHETFASRFLYE